MTISLKISKHKFFEFQIEFQKDFWNWFHFDIHLSRKQDHAGFYFNLEVMYINIWIQIYDHRHWDDENDCWIKYDRVEEINNEEINSKNK